MKAKSCLDAVLDPCAPINVGDVEQQFELTTEMQHTLKVNFSNQLMLLGYDLDSRHLTAGEALPVTVYWQSLQTMEQDYVQFNHLLDSQMIQWGGYDRQPRETYRTSCWESGQVVSDGYTLPIDANAPDGLYNLHVGLYVARDGQAVPLHLIHNGQPISATSVTIGPILIGEPPPGVVVSGVQPEYLLNVDQGDIIRLYGYDSTKLENALRIKLYWESLAQTNTEYTVFVHVLNQAGEIVAQVDRPPVEGAYPTSLWKPGEVIVDQLIVPLPDGLSTEQYFVLVGLYNFATGARLQVDGSDIDSIQIIPVED